MSNYTKHDLEVAQEIGGLKTLMQATHDKLSSYCNLHDREHKTMWMKYDDISTRVDRNTKLIYKGMGISAFIGAVLGAVGHWVKIKILG